jgi:hypothetical protein
LFVCILPDRQAAFFARQQVQRGFRLGRKAQEKPAKSAIAREFALGQKGKIRTVLSIGHGRPTGGAGTRRQKCAE